LGCQRHLEFILLFYCCSCCFNANAAAASCMAFSSFLHSEFSSLPVLSSSFFCFFCCASTRACLSFYASSIATFKSPVKMVPAPTAPTSPPRTRTLRRDGYPLFFLETLRFLEFLFFLPPRLVFLETLLERRLILLLERDSLILRCVFIYILKDFKSFV